MSRRLIASLSLVACALLAMATLALASGGSSSSSSGAPAGAAQAAVPASGTTAFSAKGKQRGSSRRGHGGAMFKMFRGMLLKSGADRLGVSTDKLEAAVKAVAEAQFAKKAAEAKLTAGEIAALKGCRHGVGQRRAAKGKDKGKGKGRGRGAACDRAAAKAAFAKFRALPDPDLAAVKTELSDALGQELGITGAKVLEAARAELSDRLDQGAKMGFVSADAKTKVLACFDAPAGCDVRALKRELLRGHRFGAGKTGHRGRGHGARRSGSKPMTTHSGSRA